MLAPLREGYFRIEQLVWWRAVAESSTGGPIAAAQHSVPGASGCFLGGAVIYTAKSRAALLDITPADMEGMRAASEPYALLLARRVHANSQRSSAHSGQDANLATDRKQQGAQSCGRMRESSSPAMIVVCRGCPGHGRGSHAELECPL